MRLTKIALLPLMMALLITPSVHADLRFSVRDGRVVIVAKDATVAEILAEWGRLGQTAIVNADQLPSEPVTLELQNVGEADALAVLLRGARAYLAQSRAAADPTASLFERIVIVKLSAVQPMPEPSAVRAATPEGSPGAHEPMMSMPVAPRSAPADSDTPPPAATPITLLQPRDARAAVAENPNASTDEPLPQAAVMDPEEIRAAQATQSLNATRRVLEVANPRDFHLPTPSRSPGTGSPTPKRP
jgi:hypothetical protein